jgi:hypothetical protein
MSVVRPFLEVLQVPINTKESYIEIGTEISDNGDMANRLVLPAPTELPSSNEFLAEASRNSVGTMVIQQIGRTQYKTEISWSKIKSEKWWEINRWFEEHGYVFWMKYFSHTMGRIVAQRFYRGNIKTGSPSKNQKAVQKGEVVYSIPESYSGVGFSIIDMGEEKVKVFEQF